MAIMIYFKIYFIFQEINYMKAFTQVYIKVCLLFVAVSADRDESISREANIYIEICNNVRTLILVIIYLQTGWN